MYVYFVCVCIFYLCMYILSMYILSMYILSMYVYFVYVFIFCLCMYILSMYVYFVYVCILYLCMYILSMLTDLSNVLDVPENVEVKRVYSVMVPANYRHSGNQGSLIFRDHFLRNFVYFGKFSRYKKHEIL